MKHSNLGILAESSPRVSTLLAVTPMQGAYSCRNSGHTWTQAQPKPANTEYSKKSNYMFPCKHACKQPKGL